MKTTDTTLLSPKYKDKWVALELKSGKVVGVGKTAVVAYAQSQKNGVKEPVLTRIPKNYGATYILGAA